MKRIMFFLSVFLFLSCHQNKKVSDEESPTPSKVVAENNNPNMSHKVHFLDSLLASLHIDTVPATKATHAWKWARQTRIDLGMTDEPIALDSLNSLSFDVDNLYAPLTAGSPIEINEAANMFAATACFRLLNAYQVLADQLSESLNEDWFIQDYKLWEDIFTEYEENNYDSYGRSTTYMLCITHKTLNELRRSLLLEEIGYLSADRDGAAVWFVNADEMQWSTDSKAIHTWYDHRMKMADALQKVSEKRAEYLRHITYKIVFIFHHLQLDWSYDFERTL